MAYPKRLGARNNAVKEKAIRIHEGTVNFVQGQIKKHGYLKAHTSPDLHWLRDLIKEVNAFAQQIELKEMPTKLAGDGENPIRLVIELPEVDGK